MPVNELWISPHRVKVRKDPLAVQAAQAAGLSYMASNTILMADDLAPSQESETLVHEALHFLWSNAGLGASDAADHEELVVTALAPRLMALLIDNPQLVTALIASDT